MEKNIQNTNEEQKSSKTINLYDVFQSMIIDNEGEIYFERQKAEEILNLVHEIECPVQLFINHCRDSDWLGEFLRSGVLEYLESKNLIDSESIQYLRNVRQVQKDFLGFLLSHEDVLYDKTMSEEEIETYIKNIANSYSERFGYAVSEYDLYEIYLNAFSNDLYAFDKYNDDVWVINSAHDYDPSGTRSFVHRLHSSKLDAVLFRARDILNLMYSVAETKEDFDKLISVIRDNDIAKNRLKEIVDNHLESNYDFESLMNYLEKPEKKNIVNI